MEAQATRPPEELDTSFPELAAEELSEIVATVREGLPAERFDVLRGMLGVSSSSGGRVACASIEPASFGNIVFATERT